MVYTVSAYDGGVTTTIIVNVMITMVAAHTVLYLFITYMHVCVSTIEELSSTIKTFTKHLNAMWHTTAPEFEPTIQSMTEFLKLHISTFLTLMHMYIT